MVLQVTHADETARAPWPAVVTTVLPNAQFLVQIESGDSPEVAAANREVIVHFAGAMRVGGVRLTAGDRVQIEISPFDPSKGRIVAHGPRRSGGH